MTDGTQDATVVVRPGQDIVASMIPDFRKKVGEILERAPGELRLDFDGVEMIDSIGIGVLIAVHNSMKKNGGKLVIVHASDDIARLFSSMRLDQHFFLER